MKPLCLYCIIVFSSRTYFNSLQSSEILNTFVLSDSSVEYMIDRLRLIWRFYYEGFRAMTWGRTLWIIILLKLFIMFFVLRLIFFVPYLSGKSDTEKQDYVGKELIQRASDSAIY